MTILLTAVLWPVESSTILLSRIACGDERTLDLGDRFLAEAHQEAIADRHPNQVASMLEKRASLEET